MKFKNLFLLLALLLLSPQQSLAADVLVAPPLFDLELEARDVITKDIIVKNQTPNKIYVYATVNEIAVDDSGDIKEFVSPVMDARESAITSWIEISRQRIEMEPGEEKTVPLTIRVNPYAVIGEYHAFIGMAVESNRPLAEAKTLRGDSDGVILKINLEDRSNYALRIVSFLTDKFVISESNRVASLTLKNEGTRVGMPTGEVIFYDSLGEEVGSTLINQSGETIEAGVSKLFEIKIPFENKLGRFKANVTVRYGEDNKQSIFDTVQFYMIPYKFLIIFAIGIFLISLLVTYLLRRVLYDELHSEDTNDDIPLYVRNDRDHTKHEHDIHISKE